MSMVLVSHQKAHNRSINARRSPQNKINSGHLKSQSAMEYLLTYGWAILIIVAVLVSMFSLGVFNATEPTAQPGACHVYKSVEGASNIGECQGIWPEFVAEFDGSSTISIPANNLPTGNTPRTITAWIDPNNEAGNRGIFYYGGVNCQPNGAIFGLILSSSNLYLWGSCDDVSSTQTLPTGVWSFIAVNYTGSKETLFYNGKEISPPNGYTSYACNSAECTSAYIGGQPGWWGGLFSGSMANVQIYNTSLSQAEIAALYQEGIGGAPIDPNHIIGWWPLNGNAQDYSGSNDNGQAVNVAYNSTWESAYTQP